MTRKHPLLTLSSLFNDASSLEKLLKLSQYLCQITAGLHHESQTVKRWDAAKVSIALTRRYLRLFKWVDCCTLVGREYEIYSVYCGGSERSLGNAGRGSTSSFSTGKGETAREFETEKSRSSQASKPTIAQWPRNSVHSLLMVLKWSFLGMYFFLEMLNITDAMGLTSNPWSRLNGLDLQREAYKMWVYGLAASLMLGGHGLVAVVQGQDDAAVASRASDTKTSPAGSGVSTKGQAETTGPRWMSREVSPRTEIPTPPALQSKDFVSLSDPSEKSRDADAAFTATVTKPLLDRNSVLKQLAIDSCDILIPGAAVGWIPLDSVSVGLAGGISASLSLKGIWRTKRDSGLGRGRARG